MLQNPVSSLAFLVANALLLIPLASLTAATNRFCKALLCNKLFLIFAIIYTLLSQIFVLVRPSKSINLLSLYNFTQLFRFQLFGAVIAACALYMALLLLTYYALRKIRQAKVQPE